jgi:hypothetical protein
MEVSGQFHAMADVPMGGRTLATNNRRLVGSESRSGHFGRERIFLPVQGIVLWVIQQVAELLHSLLYPRPHHSSCNQINYTNEKLGDFYSSSVFFTLVK